MGTISPTMMVDIAMIPPPPIPWTARAEMSQICVEGRSAASYAEVLLEICISPSSEGKENET